MISDIGIKSNSRIIALENGSRKCYPERMKAEAPPLSLYMAMHDTLMLLAMLNDKYDEILDETVPHAYDSTSNFKEESYQ